MTTLHYSHQSPTLHPARSLRLLELLLTPFLPPHLRTSSRRTLSLAPSVILPAETHCSPRLMPPALSVTSCFLLNVFPLTSTLLISSHLTTPCANPIDHSFGTLAEPSSLSQPNIRYNLDISPLPSNFSPRISRLTSPNSTPILCVRLSPCNRSGLVHLTGL